MPDKKTYLDNLAQLHTAITAGLTKKLGAAAQTVAAYPDIERRIALPAVLLELDELQPGNDPGTGETALIGLFQARCIVDPNATDAYLQLRELAARVAVAIHHQTWGLPVSPAEFVQAGTSDFRPKLDGYLVWLVEWRHEFHLGPADEWPWPDESPLTIMIGLYPETGPGNEPDYWRLGDPPPDDWGETVQRGG